MRYKIIVLNLVLIFVLMLGTLSLNAYASTTKVGFVRDGELILWDEEEYGSIQIINSRTLIPLRIISESLGLSVSWDNDRREAIVKYNDELLRFPIDKREVITSYGTKNIDVANSIINNRTHLPLRAFFELVGYDVDWQDGRDITVRAKSDTLIPEYDGYVIVKKSLSGMALGGDLIDRSIAADDRLLSMDEEESSHLSDNIENVAVDLVYGTPEEKDTQLPSDTAEVETGLQAADEIYSLYNDFPEGMYWGGDSCYYWSGNHAFSGDGGCGCVGFAYKISDLIFGVDAPVYLFEDFSDIEHTIRVGDIIATDDEYGYHEVVVTAVLEDGVEVVEGNYLSAVHWGRVISFEHLRNFGISYFTRY